MNINGETKLIGFLGTTYRTSKMYAIYNAAIEALGLNFLYVPFRVDNLATAVAGVRHLGIHAVGVTIPYKTAIIAHIDELDDNARRIGAVSVVVNRDGVLVGGNTDGKGAVQALLEKTAVQHKNVLLLGAGGAARALAFAIQDAGGRLTIANRTDAKAAELAAAAGCAAVKFNGLETTVVSADILINSTPVGMVNTPDAHESLIPAQWLRPEQTVMDLITSPRETPLLRHAQAVGCTVVYGERMLLWQGVYKFEMYTAVQPPVAVMEAALAKVN